MTDKSSPNQSEKFKRGRFLSQLYRRHAVNLIVGSVTIAISPLAKGAEPLGQVAGRRRTGPSVFKTRAANEYAQSLAQVGGCLTSPSVQLLARQPRNVPWQFDVLVIGSGYGASTVAARLATHRQPTTRIAILERGREWVPGTFPDRLPDVLDESRLDLLGPNKGTIKKATGLFNVEQFEELTVLSGSGLGGSSLINASVAIRPDRDVFEQDLWPQALRSRDFLDPYYELAEMELNARREPLDISNKMYAQRMAGQQLARFCGARWEPANITVTRTGANPAVALPILNRQGMLQRGCIDCGDCLSGCNVGAKNTLAMNYLPLARRAGVEMFTGVEVKFIRKVNHWYEVHFEHHCQQPDGSILSSAGCTTARMVMLGAGSLGSTAILMRSNYHGLQFSHRLGCGWTGNGDALGFIRKTALPTGVGGYSAFESERFPVGPTIQSNLTYPNRSLAGRVLIQDGAAPRAYATVLGAIMRNLKLDNTQILLGMGHDGAQGRVYLNEHGQPQVSWPGVLDSPYRRLIRSEFQKVAQAMGGEYEYLKLFGDRLISVHPLGGCGMSDHPTGGVVNHGGQVFDGHTGRVHEGLYVVDGAVLPTSIACNPLLTITAIAEKFSDGIVNDPRLSDLFTAERSTV
jgi:cholesterol oxidase